VEETIDLLDQCLDIKFPYSNETRLRNIAEGFSRSGRSELKKCCGAFDGIAVEINEPL